MDSARRHIIQGVQEYLVANRAQIGYVMRRPMGTISIVSMKALVAAVAAGFGLDCSEALTLVGHISGVGDATGNLFNGYGNTQSMLAHLPNYDDPKKAGIAAIVIFNADQTNLQRQHCAQVHTPDPVGGNPLLFSHGTPDGPGFITLQSLQAGFSGKTAFLNVSGL